MYQLLLAQSHKRIFWKFTSAITQATINPLVLLKIHLCQNENYIRVSRGPLCNWTQTQSRQSNSAQSDVSDAGHVRACALSGSLSASLTFSSSTPAPSPKKKKHKQAGLQGTAWTGGGGPALPLQLIKKRECVCVWVWRQVGHIIVKEEVVIHQLWPQRQVWMCVCYYLC